MEKMVIDKEFWKGKRVFLTGHTGFKGAWMSIYLHSLGAKVTGYSLDPVTTINLYKEANISTLLEQDLHGDIRDLGELTAAMKEAKADIVFHMAAQSLVIEGYENPVDTYTSNVIGTVHVMEAMRYLPEIKAGVIVTTDKCYQNRELDDGYTENDRLGGHDPYSNSKACAELVVSSYRDSFFSENNSLKIATTRAGNVIGGGDWSENRLVPDCVRAFAKGDQVLLRSPKAIRPWQHVLEPLTGYLQLAERLVKDKQQNFSGAWNFGPRRNAEITTLNLANQIAKFWGENTSVVCDPKTAAYIETNMLRLNSKKSQENLEWKQRWDIEQTLKETVSWYKSVEHGSDALEVSLQQIHDYLKFV